MSLRPQSALQARRRGPSATRPTSAAPYRAQTTTHVNDNSIPLTAAGGGGGRGAPTLNNSAPPATLAHHLQAAGGQHQQSSVNSAGYYPQPARVRPHSAVLRSREQQQQANSYSQPSPLHYPSPTSTNDDAGSRSLKPIVGRPRPPSAAASRNARPADGGYSNRSGYSAHSAGTPYSANSGSATSTGGRPLSASVPMPPCVTVATAQRAQAAAERQRRVQRARNRLAESDAQILLTEIYDLCEETRVGGRFVSDFQSAIAAAAESRRAAGIVDEYGRELAIGAAEEDLDFLAATRRELLSHKMVLMHVLSRVEARERVMAALGAFVKAHTVGEGARRALGEREEIAALRRQPLGAAAEVEGESIVASLQLCTSLVHQALAEWRVSLDRLGSIGGGGNHQQQQTPTALHRTSSTLSSARSTATREHNNNNNNNYNGSTSSLPQHNTNTNTSLASAASCPSGAPISVQRSRLLPADGGRRRARPPTPPRVGPQRRAAPGGRGRRANGGA